MATPEFIQRAYIAFFNRPADKEGFNFWQSTELPDQALLDQFAQSPEYRSDYAGKSNKQIIEMVYNNLFGRVPEKEGWDYWAKQMDEGWVTVGNAAHEILGGAQGTDLSTINNKTTAAQFFTQSLRTTQEITAYAHAGDFGMGNVAKEWLAEVGDGIKSRAIAELNVNSILTNLVNEARNQIPDLIEPTAPIPYLIISQATTTVTLPTTPNVQDTIKWDGGFGNNHHKVANFESVDHLDFTAYGASAVFSSTLVDQVAASQKWHGGMTFSAGGKYLSLTRTDLSTTEYKIELWTHQGGKLDAYGGNTLSVGPGPEKPDTAQLIGYVDLGLDLNASGASINIDL